jgi:peptide-methionine (R)-S-oxide reductase
MDKVKKSDEEWQAQLNAETYHVTRQGGTEPPWSGALNQEKRIGVFGCVCCELPLFKSDAKFESGCGWPSFFEPLDGASLVEIEDGSHGMVRVEVRCSRCDAHLGHVFPDGPKHNGLRYCINSVCLGFEPE